MAPVEPQTYCIVPLRRVQDRRLYVEQKLSGEMGGDPWGKSQQHREAVSVQMKGEKSVDASLFNAQLSEGLTVCERGVQSETYGQTRHHIMGGW